MIPLRDDQPRFSTPYVTYFLIGLNSAIFLFESALTPESFKTLLFQFGMISANITGYLSAASGPGLVAVLLPALTSMFLHGSWMHVIGNMWFLWIFGDNVEDLMGHGGYLIFYLAVGVVASATHVLMNKLSTNPLIGASGAIAGVLGAYTVLFPRARILSLIPLGLFTRFIAIPAFLFLPLWFVMQFVYGLASLAGTGEGVAWWAHVGGFIAGIVLVPVFVHRRR